MILYKRYINTIQINSKDQFENLDSNFISVKQLSKGLSGLQEGRGELLAYEGFRITSASLLNNLNKSILNDLIMEKIKSN